MSTFNVKSTFISNRDASPKVLTDPFQGTGIPKAMTGVENIPQTAGILSTVKLLSIPAGAKLQTLEHCAGALGTSAIDMAVWYPTNVPGGAVIAQSLSGTLISSSWATSNITGVDTAISWTDSFGTVANFGIAKRSYALWQILGLSADPLVDLDVGFTVRTANAIAGYVGLRAMFVK